MPVLTQCRRSRVLVLLVALVWDGFGMTIHDGVFEFEAELKRDIVYWASLSPSVPVPAWTDACSSLVYNGRRGSLGRFYTKEENDRAYAVIDKYNLKCGMEPSDAAVEGRWVSSDGTIIWENGICAQQYCNWRPGAPDNLWQSGEASLLFQQSDLGKWNDITAGSVWQVLCEFRCTADADCNGSGDGDKWVCHATTGRCVKLNECSKYAVEQNEDGYAESEEYDDVAFWISKTAVRRPTAETTCKLMCRNGRPGRLARMVSEQEYQRVVALGKSASVDQAHVDGSDFGHEGVWKYSDGSIFYDDAADDGLQCKQERCFWGVDAPSSQAGEHYLEAKLNDNAAHWNDAKRDAAAKGYICEFPCYSDEECHETAGLEYMCHKHGRCVRKSQCSVYGAVSLSAGRLSSGKDIRFWYSGTDLQYKRADAQATCNALCVDGRYGRLLQVHSQAEDMAVKTLMGVSTDAVSNIGPKGLHMDGIDIMIVGVRKYKWSSGWWWYSGVCRQAFCNWAPGNPAHKLYIHQNANSQWVSTTPEEDTERPFVCEFACTSDDDCDVGYFCLLREGRCMLKTGGSCNNGMVAFTEGQAETTEYKDIRYWLSDESLYEYYARRYVCFLLCHDGKIGRVARVYSRDEMTRTQSLLAIQGVFRAGIDAIEQTEMTFVWADGGGVVWTKDGGCQQKFCDFSANEPNNGQQGIENNLEVIVSRGWNDNWGGRLSNALCEFPCVSDRDCESSGSDYTCHFTGRCVHHSNCNPESPVPLSDGTLEDTASADITFWHSKTLTHTTTEAQAVCSALCHNGRHGRLARITSADENTRVAKLSQSVQSHTDGVTDTAAWMWADDGHIFYVADSGCTGYCAWNLPPSRGSAGTLSTKSSWVVVAGGQQLPFTCEFPCVTDFDCIGSDEPCPVYECNVHGRCVLNPGCYRDGRCSSFKTEADCGAKGTCEWDQAVGAKGACVDEPCQYGDKAACGLDASCDWNEACGDAAAHECVPKRCAATASAACTADVRCRWSGSACAPAPCVEYPSEACCDASAGCEWSLASSPAYCKQTYCSGAHAAQTPCQADAQCAWHGGICVAFSCRLHAGAECECKAHDACLWDPVIKSCDSATFTACPALDVVVLLDGSAAMASGFGRHPHGNLALAEVLRDWVRALPLSGEKAGAAAPAVPSGFRVGFVQYAASEAFAAIGRATDYSNVGTKGRLSGDLAELEADLTWHEQNLVGGPSKIDKGLVVANGMFEASNQPRARILLAFACGGIQDSSSVAASLAPLDAKNVDRFGITLRRSSTQSLAEQAADTSLRAIASLPTADHTLSCLSPKSKAASCSTCVTLRLNSAASSYLKRRNQCKLGSTKLAYTTRTAMAARRTQDARGDRWTKSV
ncbi:hypothetical protein DIPPA_09018 [Diplonema papillatum]|nr:hypothetical protein DIPPA_09018 [Diplonema papillatum]